MLLITVLYFWLHDENQVNESSDFYPLFSLISGDWKPQIQFFLIFNFTFFCASIQNAEKHAHGLWYPAPKCHSFLTREWPMNLFTGMLNLSCTRHLSHKNKSDQTEAHVGLFAREKKWVGLFIRGDKKVKVMESIAKPFCCTHSSVDWKI